jgi:hypothetical protein
LVVFPPSLSYSMARQRMREMEVRAAREAAARVRSSEPRRPSPMRRRAGLVLVRAGLRLAWGPPR